MLRRGKLSTFTLCHVAPAGFDTPYLAAWVSFPEGPTVFGVLRLREDLLTPSPSPSRGEGSFSPAYSRVGPPRPSEGGLDRVGVRGGDPVEVAIVPRESGPGWEFRPDRSLKTDN
jgi:hypothetical protein